jgi:hypothetical protein
MTVFAISCTNAAVEEMGSGGPPVPWDAADKFDGEDGFMPLAYAAEAGDWARARQVASGEKFEQALNEFAAAPAPADWADRADEKDAAVQDLKALIKVSREGSSNDMQLAYQKAVESLKQVRAPR